MPNSSASNGIRTVSYTHLEGKSCIYSARFFEVTKPSLIPCARRPSSASRVPGNTRTRSRWANRRSFHRCTRRSISASGAPSWRSMSSVSYTHLARAHSPPGGAFAGRGSARLKRAGAMPFEPVFQLRRRGMAVPWNPSLCVPFCARVEGGMAAQRGRFCGMFRAPALAAHRESRGPFEPLFQLRKRGNRRPLETLSLIHIYFRQCCGAACSKTALADRKLHKWKQTSSAASKQGRTSEERPET